MKFIGVCSWLMKVHRKIGMITLGLITGRGGFFGLTLMSITRSCLWPCRKVFSSCPQKKTSGTVIKIYSKCKEGEACPLCVNPNACTDEEKDEFVTVGDCFGNVILGPSEAPATTEPSSELSETEINASYIVFALILLFLLLLAGYFLLSRRTKTIWSSQGFIKETNLLNDWCLTPL